MLTSETLLAHWDPIGATTVKASAENQPPPKLHDRLIGVKFVLTSSGPLIELPVNGGLTDVAERPINSPWTIPAP